MQQIKKIDLVRNSSKNKSFQEIYDFNKSYKLVQGSYEMDYKTVHRETGLSRAVKIIHKASVNYKERLNNELRTVVLLVFWKLSLFKDHKDIIKVFETYEDTDYIIELMEYVRRRYLDKVLEYGNFYNKEVQLYSQKLLDLLMTKSLNMVHRDLKPENVLFQKYNNLDSLYIIDFGLSKVFQPGLLHQ
ncbi:unnamed protein product [Paramecium sonneborni]|uniref:Protein kinase domain-containing protein n=1 Tax=Paramecium sonneborni TaxID=65129 RepID=A0A8S1JXZ5_9CILI|nr:unnamed protein product [Paramecium sonneborni]